jgi:hypothetical protein
MEIKSNKGLSTKLSSSELSDKTDSFYLNSLFGVWEDSRDSDKIISEIIESRVEKNDSEAF